MTSSKFNSPKSLNKTPGVCRAYRQTEIPTVQPPPNNNWPGRIFYNATFKVDFGSGSEEFEAMSRSVETQTEEGLYIQFFFLSATRSAVISIRWDAIIFERLIRLTAFDRTSPQIADVVDTQILGPDFRPIVYNGINLGTAPKVLLAVVDIWS